MTCGSLQLLDLRLWAQPRRSHSLAICQEYRARKKRPGRTQSAPKQEKPYAHLRCFARFCPFAKKLLVLVINSLNSCPSSNANDYHNPRKPLKHRQKVDNRCSSRILPYPCMHGHTITQQIEKQVTKTYSVYDLGFSFFSFHSADRPTPETLTTLNRTPGISPLALPLRPKPARRTSSFSSTKLRQPSLGTVRVMD